MQRVLWTPQQGTHRCKWHNAVSIVIEWEIYGDQTERYRSTSTLRLNNARHQHLVHAILVHIDNFKTIA